MQASLSLTILAKLHLFYMFYTIEHDINIFIIKILVRLLFYANRHNTLHFSTFPMRIILTLNSNCVEVTLLP